MLIGKFLAERYLITDVLSAGGFSETYLARDFRLPTHPFRVVKCLTPPAGVSLDLARQLFEVESNSLHTLGQQNQLIPTLFAHFEDNQQFYLIQEYIEGENLAVYLDQGRRFDQTQSIEFLLDVLSTLDCIHQQHVIHRDIKPSNLIRRSSDRRYVLIDFGSVAQILRTAETDSVQFDNLLIGTPGYMSPEQERGLDRFSNDIFALGVTTIQLLSGVHPAQLTVEQDEHRFSNEWSNQIQIHPQLVSILMRMSELNHSRRYQHCAEVIADLMQLQSDGAVSVLPSAWWQAIPFYRIKPWLSLQWWTPRRILSLICVGLLVFPVVLNRFNLSQWMTWYNTMIQTSSTPRAQAGLLYQLDTAMPVQSIWSSADSTLAITTDETHQLQLWTIANGQLVQSLQGHTDSVRSVVTTRDGHWLISGGRDRTVRIWNLQAGGVLSKLIDLPAPVVKLALHPAEQSVAVATDDRSVHLVDITTGRTQSIFTDPSAVVTHLVYVSERDLATANQLNEIRLWDIQRRQLRRAFSAHTDMILGLSVDAHPSRLYSIGREKIIWWNLQTEMVEKIIPLDIQATAFQFSSNRLVTVHTDGSLRVWIKEQFYLLPVPLNLVSAICLTNDFCYLIHGSQENKMQIWKIETPKSFSII